MNETLLAEDMKTTPKVAFVNKPYTQEERTKRDEKELEQLKKEHAGEAEEVEAEEAAIDSYVEQSTGRDDDFGGFDDKSPTGDAEDEGDFAFAKGGLAKQMKRSGLASKK